MRVVLTLLFACGTSSAHDAAATDAAFDAVVDAGAIDTRPDVDTAHCGFEPLPATAGAGGRVMPLPIHAGTAERFLNVPLGTTLGAYATRSPIGRNGFIDGRVSVLAGKFAPSVAIETRPRARALAISVGEAPDYEDTLLLLKADLGIAHAALVRAVELRLPAELHGKIIFATSHTHSSFANYATDAMQLAFGPFQRLVHDRIVDDLEAVALEALAARAPARLGLASTDVFDLADVVTRDRRPENDHLPGGQSDDRHAYVMRVDAADGSPVAVVPVFGMHGTIHDANNVVISTDASGGVERVLEEQFDSPVLVMHLQGAGGDVSPVGLEHGPDCPDASVLCHNYPRSETIGRRVLPELLALWDAAGDALEDEIALEVVTRSVERGPDPSRFDVRDGALQYAAWDGVARADGRIFDSTGNVLSPIDEFNAPYGAALCSSDGRTAALLPAAQIPGTRHPDLLTTPYSTCNRIEALAEIVGPSLGLEVAGLPLCDTTRGLLSAARIGDWYLSTLPGEPTILARERLREISPVDPERLIVVGCAQDHHGYVLTAEDWLAGGYEPSITFWGPLDGEQLIESSAHLLTVLTTDARENAAQGSTRATVLLSTEALEPDRAPLAGSIPTALPTLTNRLLPTQPATANLPTSAARLASVFFTWIGEDPLEGTPTVAIERRADDGSFLPLTRRSGRTVHEGDLILAWTPDPLEGASGRTHYWTVEWQLVPPLGNPTVDARDELSARLGLELGVYRIRVEGEGYSVTSGELEVRAAELEVAVAVSSFSVAASSDSGFRLLDDVIGATGTIPLRSQTVVVEARYADGTNQRLDVELDASGSASLPVRAGEPPVELAVTDVYGNAGTVAWGDEP